MQIITKTALLVACSAGLMFGETFTGKLVDANCKVGPSTSSPANSAKSGELPENCAVTTSTKMFAIQTPDGQLYKLDAAGNAKAAAAVKAEPDRTQQATVSGSREGEMLKVESIDIR